MEEDKDILDILLMVNTLREAHECLTEMSGRRYWVNPEYQDRDTKGFFALHFDRIYKRNTTQFKQLVGMNREVFDILFGFLEEGLSKNSNRPSISAKCRLFLTLTYLCQGGNTRTLCEKFKMGLTTVKRIISDTCEILWNELSHCYICPPQGQEWLRISEEFQNDWKMPNCVGAVDIKRIDLSAAPVNNAVNGKYKTKEILTLMASCDANYMFTNIDIGVCNAQSDNISWNLDFCKQLLNGKLDLPPNHVLPQSDINFPYYFIGSTSFPLKTHLMRKYGSQTAPDQQIFNDHLTKVHSVIENTFGILTARWKVIQNPLHMGAASAERIIKAVVLLHNFLKCHDESYCPPGYVDAYEGDDIVEGLWRQQVTNPLKSFKRHSSNNATKNAFETRDCLMFYIKSIKEIYETNNLNIET